LLIGALAQPARTPPNAVTAAIESPRMNASVNTCPLRN
jgi:hypothetical protein